MSAVHVIFVKMVGGGDEVEELRGLRRSIYNKNNFFN